MLKLGSWGYKKVMQKAYKGCKNALKMLKWHELPAVFHHVEDNVRVSALNVGLVEDFLYHARKVRTVFACDKGDRVVVAGNVVNGSRLRQGAQFLFNLKKMPF